MIYRCNPSRRALIGPGGINLREMIFIGQGGADADRGCRIRMSAKAIMPMDEGVCFVARTGDPFDACAWRHGSLR